MSVITDYLLIRPATRALVKQLDGLAASGDFDLPLLDQLRELPEITGSRMAVYYLASLYLQSDEESAARQILLSLNGSSSVMKKFYRVLSCSRRNNLAVPELSTVEKSCIEYLDAAVNPPANSIEHQLSEAGGFSIVGNAPGTTVKNTPDEWCRFYFNSYLKNPAITDRASIHVVTPSWQTDETESDSSLCITGNSIFHRRSHVWRKFIDKKDHPAIYTVPRSLWRSLYLELGTSPSAGLLIAGLLAEITARKPQTLSGYIAGFSFGISGSNHEYDAEPASSRHNWTGEAVVLKRLIGELENNCSKLTVEY